ncbi:MAG: asparagine synthase (glutamine-hydrolyzing) [Pelagibacteraceae bacterium]|nr:asparagine synthase (glutamine-hydrolyzing) [Pelagibacteraceae bacterium]
MCGIAGYYGSKIINDSRIESCLRLMGRRGPDNNGYFHKKLTQDLNVQILHSRLKILDLDSRSNQPFLSSDSCLSFNGEIYNYLELREDLKKLGKIFNTNSDTEVLSTILEEFGVLGLDRCEGMWAFVWLKADKLILSRDRFGEKPLYIYEDESGIFFGSEPKFIFALLGFNLPINRNHLIRYLINGYKALYKNQDTFFVGLKELQPGMVMKVFNDGRKEVSKYWNPNFNQQKENMSFSEAVGLAREALIKSVGLRLRADVPIAFCLSGGIDSNALIAIAKKHFKYDVHGFTIMNTDSRYEERDMVEKSVSQLELRHSPVAIDQSNFIENLRDIIKYHDSPISTITYYAQWQLMSFIAAEGYKVSISGTAADELFSGYYDHHNFYIQALDGNPKEQEIARNNWKEIVASIVRNPYLQNPDCFILNKDLRDHIYLDAQFFSTFLVNPWSEKFTEQYYCPTILRNRMNNELFHESVPVILHEDDLNSMYFSIENRSPFLDRNLFDVCQKIPTKHLIRDGKAKAILREAVRGIAPDFILDNPRKVGFNVPIENYIDLKNPAVQAQIFKDSEIFSIVKKESIKQLIEKTHLPNSQSKFLFYFLNAKIFLEEFGGAESYEMV